jgi:hypothetical protein
MVRLPFRVHCRQWPPGDLSMSTAGAGARHSEGAGRPGDAGERPLQGIHGGSEVDEA